MGLKHSNEQDSPIEQRSERCGGPKSAGGNLCFVIMMAGNLDLILSLFRVKGGLHEEVEAEGSCRRLF